MNYSYDEIINKIENTRRFGKYTGFEVSKHMLERLGNPQSGIPFVHIAGTNGKGSTTAFLCSILQQTGKKIGMFTSPHLITFRERIRINGKYISEEDVTRLGNLLLNTQFELPPTMFDYCLAMAVLYFKEQQCDLMVIETGIGGRYDSTNALGTPLAAVITKIGFDHTAVLGDTLEQIAGEKAGIIKRGCPVITLEQEPCVTEVLLENYKLVNELPDIPQILHSTNSCAATYFANMNADAETIPLQSVSDARAETISLQLVCDTETEAVQRLQSGDKVGEDVFVLRNEEKEQFTKIHQPGFYEVCSADLEYVSGIPMKMQGSYQIENAAAAMLAARVLFSIQTLLDETTQESGVNTDEGINDRSILSKQSEYAETCIRTGIANTFWKGRMELMNENPFFMIDGAHNAHGVHALAQSLSALYPNEKFHFIMAVMADKDYEDMIEELLPLALDFITVTPESNRALQSKDLAACIAKKGVKARYAEDMESVIRPLLPQKHQVNEITSRIKKTDGEVHIYLPDNQYKTIAFGSLYFIGAIEAMLEREG